MNVYIKGIDVPKEGTVIVIDSTGQVWSNEWPTRGYTRIDGAKAVPVPDHGRLIDADATVSLLRDLGSRDYRREKGTICDAIKMVMHEQYTPTIIQADKEET